MRLGAIVLKLRLDKTYFGNYIGGASDLATAIKWTLKKDMAFVIPLVEEAVENQLENGNSQKIVERFGVVVALANDMRLTSKFGFAAMELLHHVRSQFFKSLVLWELPFAEEKITYRGGNLVDINPAYLWYQFEFEYTSRLIGNELFEKDVEIRTRTVFEIAEQIMLSNSGLANSGAYDGMTAEQILASIPPEEVPVDFDTIYMQLVQTPSENIPYTDGPLPVLDGVMDVSLPNVENWIDMTENPFDGSFQRGFTSGFDILTNN